MFKKEMISFVEILYPKCHDPNGVYSDLKGAIRRTLFFAKQYAKNQDRTSWDCMMQENCELAGMLTILYHIGMITEEDNYRIQRVVYKTAINRACK